MIQLLAPCGFTQQKIQQNTKKLVSKQYNRIEQLEFIVTAVQYLLSDHTEILDVVRLLEQPHQRLHAHSETSIRLVPAMR